MHRARTGERGEESDLAALQLRTALHAYGHIFPAEAPAPTLVELTGTWAQRLVPDRSGARRVFVVDGTGGPAGVAVAGLDEQAPAVGHLSGLYVDPACWGSGIGAALHHAAVTHLRQVGFRSATLWVLEANERARAWYERLGWVADGAVRPIYEPGGVIDVRYERQLT